MEREREEYQAAIKMQAAWRGHAVRKLLHLETARQKAFVAQRILGRPMRFQHHDAKTAVRPWDNYQSFMPRHRNRNNEEEPTNQQDLKFGPPQPWSFTPAETIEEDIAAARNAIDARLNWAYRRLPRHVANEGLGALVGTGDLRTIALEATRSAAKRAFTASASGPLQPPRPPRQFIVSTSSPSIGLGSAIGAGSASQPQAPVQNSIGRPRSADIQGPFSSAVSGQGQQSSPANLRSPRARSHRDNAGKSNTPITAQRTDRSNRARRKMDVQKPLPPAASSPQLQSTRQRKKARDNTGENSTVRFFADLSPDMSHVSGAGSCPPPAAGRIRAGPSLQSDWRAVATPRDRRNDQKAPIAPSTAGPSGPANSSTPTAGGLSPTSRNPMSAPRASRIRTNQGALSDPSSFSSSTAGPLPPPSAGSVKLTS